jgi:cytochrome P450
MADAALAREGSGAVPSHVPADLVINCDFYSNPGFTTNPFKEIEWQRTGPRIFYSPSHYMFPGGWVITRAEDIRHVLQSPELFSSREQVSFSQLVGESWDLIPLELDAPDHSRFRSLLNPLFSPKAVNKLEDGLRGTSHRLLDEITKVKETDFSLSFAEIFPVSVFLQILGLPQEEMPIFLDWEHGLLKSFNLETRKQSARKILNYLRNAIQERRQTLRDDLISYAVQLNVEGRPVTDDEIVGICFLLFVAGLDTVAMSLGFQFYHLATDQALQKRLRENRKLIPDAVEEFLRLYSIIQVHRRVAKDTEIGGVFMKAGDWVTVPTANGSRDAKEFPDPDQFNMDRGDNRHVAFSFGMHRCIGSHLARREFVVAINAWFDRVPQFRLKGGDDSFRTNGGAVFSVMKLCLAWD